MLDEFRIAGGRLVVREIADRAAIQALPEKLVFNCTGLGAKALFDDDELTPVKGQLTFLLPQPEVQYATIVGDLYMFSRSDGILLGGTHEEGGGRSNLTSSASGNHRRPQGVLRLVPSLLTAPPPDRR
jgi:glycine/D-amino acid oxidase-like deaminating enzyme